MVLFGLSFILPVTCFDFVSCFLLLQNFGQTTSFVVHISAPLPADSQCGSVSSNKRHHCASMLLLDATETERIRCKLPGRFPPSRLASQTSDTNRPFKTPRCPAAGSRATEAAAAAASSGHIPARGTELRWKAGELFSRRRVPLQPAAAVIDR